MSELLHILSEFWSVSAELAPWLLLGCLLAGVLHVVMPPDLVRTHLGGSRFMNVVKAVLLGVPLPLCSCSVLPAGLALKKDGASDGAAVGFLISTPQTGVDSITVSAAMLGWPFAILKVVAATVTGLLGGVLTNLTTPPNHGIQADAGPRQRRAGRTVTGLVAETLEYAFVELLAGIWKWLLAGLLVSAVVGALVPTQALTGKAWAGGFTGMLVMLAIGIPLYVCTTGSLPIAAALVRAGMSPGAALVFLMAGPATNAATIAAIWRALGRRVTAIYLGTIIAGSLLFGWLFDAVVQVAPGAAPDCHLAAPGGIGQASALALFCLFAYLAFRDWRARRSGAGAACCQAKDTTSAETLQLAVKGLTCPNCSRKLQRALAALNGVTAVVVDHGSGQATVTGQGLRREDLLAAVRRAGFEPG
jgi:uncharacterized membrane protein YraQ (UPF0718 family)/copper chaperone CopZ